MRQFHVPQFIEVEDKIFGPLTLRQFIYLAGGAAIVIIFYFTLPFWLMVLFSLPFAALAAALAFYKVNSQPFVHVLGSALSYVFQKKLYLWKKKTFAKDDVAPTAVVKRAGADIPKLSGRSLKDLAWSLDVKEKIK
ncbi:MAG: PrgI family protein [Parcubacteria group bacterium]|nr:PrgI family protein [Parcubacteria group bacterium]